MNNPNQDIYPFQVAERRCQNCGRLFSPNAESRWYDTTGIDYQGLWIGRLWFCRQDCRAEYLAGVKMPQNASHSAPNPNAAQASG